MKQLRLKAICTVYGRGDESTDYMFFEVGEDMWCYCHMSADVDETGWADEDAEWFCHFSSRESGNNFAKHLKEIGGDFWNMEKQDQEILADMAGNLLACFDNIGDYEIREM